MRWRPDAARAARLCGAPFSMWAMCVCVLSFGVSCTAKQEAPPLQGTPPEGLDWDDNRPEFLPVPQRVEPYTGDSAPVLEAQVRMPTGSALHSEVILRSCGPLGGVCHNRKEYPDMRTPANFVNLVGAPCNVQSGTPQGVFDRCERPGDKVRFRDQGTEYELGWLEIVAPGSEEENTDGTLSPRVPGLHLHFDRAVDEAEFRDWATARFSRVFVQDGQIQSLRYANFGTRWTRLDEGRLVVGEVRDYQVAEVEELLRIGIEQGDLNRNGIYGARPDEDGQVHGPVAMIEPGDPETSYMVARMRGHMRGEPVPGSRMPLANPPFSVAEMVALFCFIEGLEPGSAINLESEIDYKNCSYNEQEQHAPLAIEGAGKNWSDRIAPLLNSNCGGCHSEERAEGELVLVGQGVYDFLLENRSKNDPQGRQFVKPGDAQNSYLFLKLIADESIEGKGMPIDPLEGVRTLSDTELFDIEAWITDGAAP